MRSTSRMPHWLMALLLLKAATVAFAQAPHLDYSILLGEDDWDAGDAATHIAVDGAGQAWVVAAGTRFTPAPAEEVPQDYSIYSIARLSPAGALLSATPFGGSGYEGIHSIHLDAAGNLYLVGSTRSPDFPMTQLVGPPGAINEAFVVKLDPAGDLVYSTRFRGTPSLPSLSLIDIAVDAQGQAHVVGKIAASAYGGASYMFIAKLSADGSSLIYSLQLGGAARGIALDSAGNAHVAGFIHSEAMVLKLGPDGSRIYSTLLGGSGEDWAQAIAIDPAGNALVYGVTASPDFPVRDALQPQAAFVPYDPDHPYNEPYDTFLTRLDPAGALLGSTFLGGTSGDSAIALSVNPAGFIYLLGSTWSAEDFPLRDPLPVQLSPPWDYGVNHVTVLNPQASEILFSTFVDGTDGDEWGYVYGMAVDAVGSIYLSGMTSDPEFPVIGPSQKTQANYWYDAFVLKIDLGQGGTPDCSAAAVTPGTIWPPDGRMAPVAIRGVTDPDGDPVSVAITAVFQDEPLAKKGQPDAAGLGTSTPRVRASRAGNGDGRVYHLTFTATDPQGASCTGAVTVCVPHDQGKRSTCGDGGSVIDSAGRR